MTLDEIKAAVERMDNSDLTRDEKDLIGKLVAIAEAAKRLVSNCGVHPDGRIETKSADMESLAETVNALDELDVQP